MIQMAIFRTMCISILLIHITFNIDAKQIPTGILEVRTYKSDIKGHTHKKLYIYLPSDYYTNREKYPVAFFLHGANGNERSWIDDGDILYYIDSLTKSNELRPAIYVFPNMNRYSNEYDYLFSNPKGSIESYLSLDGSGEESFIKDIIGYIDNNYRTLHTKNSRAIAGLSLGGLNTLYISANADGCFGYVGLFSPLIYPPSNKGRYREIYRDLHKKLSNQFHLSPSLYMIIIGEDDPYYRSASKYNDYLDGQDYNHIFLKTTGGHTWENWRAYSILFLKSLWKEE